MSILKDINVGIVPYEYMIKTHDYLADDLKTENGKYVDGVGFINKNKMMDKFMAVKISNQKPGGRLFRQITVVPSPAGNDISNDEFMEMGLKLAKIYADKGYQTGAFLHLDTDTRHLHLMVNTVSYATGMKISLSKHDLNLIKLNINRVLPEYGFDPIGKTVDEIMDSEVHDITENFDCLEIFDEILADKANIFSDIIGSSSLALIMPSSSNKLFNSCGQYSVSSATGYSAQRKP